MVNLNSINLLFYVLVLLIFALVLTFLMNEFRVGSLNLNGARKAKKRAVLFEMALLKHIDVLFLQETHGDLTNEADWRREWEGRVILSHHTTLSAGVGFLFSKAFTPTALEVEHIVNGRCLLVKGRFDHFTVLFVNIYAPNNGEERKEFF